MKENLKPSYLWLFALLLGVAACQAAPLTVGNKYMDAVQQGNTEAMLAMVSDNVTMVVDGGPIFHQELIGKKALEDYARGLAASGFQLELTGSPVASGNQLTYPDRFAVNDFKQVGVEWVTGKDVLIIENGKVTRDVWTIDEAASQQLAAAFAAVQGLTPEKLAKTWRYDGEGGIADLRYRNDGTYEMIRYIIGDETLWDVGTYTIEGDHVTLTTSKAYYCRVGDRGIYQMAITEDGLLQSSVVEDACWRRKPPVEGAIYLTVVTP